MRNDMQLIKLAVIILGVIFTMPRCVTSPPAKEAREEDSGWNQFLTVANALDLSSNNLDEYYDAIKTLDLKDCYIQGPVLIAEGTRKQVSRQPAPKAWEGDDQVLVASGDVDGDGKSEYILGAGWSGPFAGVLAVYDSDLKKLAELKMECIWGVEIQDITGDGADEIICREDQHHGSGLWQQRMTIVKYLEGKGLVVVWSGNTYNEAGTYLDKYDIWIEQKKCQPARIWERHTYEQFLEPADRYDNRELVQRNPNELSSYIWNPATLQFEKDETNVGKSTDLGERGN